MSIICCLQAINKDAYNDIINGDEVLLEELVEDDDTDDSFTLDRTWDGIDYLISKTIAGRNLLLAFLKSGGTEFEYNSMESAVDSVRAFSREDVIEIEKALVSISEHEFRSNFDAEEMNSSTYPQTFHYDGTLDDLCADFFELRDYMSEVRGANKALLVWFA